MTSVSPITSPFQGLATPENQSRWAGGALILRNMFRLAVRLAPAAAGALSAALVCTKPGGKRG